MWAGGLSKQKAETVKSPPSPPMTNASTAHPDPGSLIENSLGVIGPSNKTRSSPPEIKSIK